MIISWVVPYIDKNNYENIVSTRRDGIEVKRTAYKRANKYRYINTDDLSAENKIFVDIALQAQNLTGTYSYWLNLKDLFIEGSWAGIPHTKHQAVTAINYFENSSGEQISRNRYMEEHLGLPSTITTYNGLQVPADLSEELAKQINIPELISFKKEDFNLSSEQIDTLNRFIKNFLDLQESSLCKQPSAMTLVCSEKNKCYISKSISQEQYIASIIIFRRVYGNEPAAFNKAVGILQDKRVNQHPNIQIINNANRRYNNILSQPVCQNGLWGDYIRDNMRGTYCPTGKELIKVFFNVECIHQGDQETKSLKNKIESSIPNLDLLQFVFWGILQDLKCAMAIVASCAIEILSFLGQLSVNKPEPIISNKEHLLHIYIVNKVYELAEIIWNENKCDTPSMIFYRDTALARITEKFSLDKSLFKDLLPPVDYQEIAKNNSWGKWRENK